MPVHSCPSDPCPICAGPKAATSFADTIARLANERLAFIRANRERLVEAWIAETGLLPSESLQIEQQLPGGGVEVRIVRRPPEAAPSDLDAFRAMLKRADVGFRWGTVNADGDEVIVTGRSGLARLWFDAAGALRRVDGGV